MEKKNILFTFDYELFLGKRSGSVDRCVIEPTQKIISILSAYKARVVFFVDTLWLVRLRELIETNAQAKKDYDKVAQQLQQLSQSGHYIFPHLHPHWLNASYLPEINQWQLTDYSKYRMHSLDKNERARLFEKSMAILKDILGEKYVPVGYRAGGWSIQPFEDFEPLFRQYGIKYDFSVLSGHKCISSGQQYDFSDIHINHPYRFLNDVTVPGEGEYAEFPISVIAVSPFKKVLNKMLLKYLWRKGDRGAGDGQGIVTETIEGNDSRNKTEMVSIELLTAVKLPVYKQFLKENKYMQFIAHPKMLSFHNIGTFARFMKATYSQYDIETDFMKILSV